MQVQSNKVETGKEEFRWSLRKKGKQVLTLCTHLIYTAVIAAVFSVGEAQANPTGGNVTAGSATISSSGSTLQINQHTNRAVIEWGGFDIAAGETTQFIQPGASSVALNRVVNANQASVINGNLLANGKVLVINPNGVLIGKTGNVDVAGFVASTADIDDNSFMNASGAMNFDKAGNANATVENQGRITIGDEGLGLLVAPTVRNSGVIEGNLAKVHMGAGDTFGVDLYGDGLLHLAVADNATARTLTAENTGNIVANAGKVVMTAAAASNVVKSVINNEGVVEAKGLVSKGGEIILTGAGATVKVSGKLDASGKTGGGSVKIGGDYQGGGTLAKADEVHVTETAVVKANAEESGNGGTIIVWAEKIAEAIGDFFAQGGATAGNGGLVETSSKGDLFVEGIYVDTTAAKGLMGDWLLDPDNITIVSGGGTAYNPGAGGNHDNSPVNGGNVNITNTSLNSWTTSNIILGANLDITFSANLNLSPNISLTANAGDDITIGNNSIVLNNGNLTLNAGNDVVINNSTIDTNGGDFTVTAHDDLSFNGSGANPVIVNTDGGDIIFTVVDDFGSDPTDTFSTSSGRFGTSGGNFTLSVQAGSVAFQGTTINTTGGSSGGSISVAEIGDSNVTASELGNNNNYYSGNFGGDISIAASNVVPGNNNNCFKAGGTAGNCADVPDPVTTANITITAPNQIITYGSTLFNTLNYSVSVGALLSGDTLGGNLTRVSPTTWTVGNYDILQGTVGVTALAGHLYNITWSLGDLIINPALLTITAQDQSKTYGQLLNLGTTAINTSGLKFSDTVTGATLASAGTPVTATVGNYAITATNATGTGLSNYTINYVNGNLLVNPKLLTVTANSFGKTYGSTYTFLGTEFSTSGLINGNTVTSATLTSAGAAGTATVGNYATVATNAVGSGLSNYTISYVNGNLNVTPKALTVTANSFGKTYGSAYTFLGNEFSTSGLVNGDTVTSATLTSAGALATATVGGYAITASGAVGTGLSNYTIGYLPGTLTVSPKTLNVIANSFSKEYGDTYTFTGGEFTTNGLVNGDTVSSVSLSSAGAAATAQVAAPGPTYAITANTAVGTGLSNYTVNYVDGTLTVTPAPLSVQTLNQTKVYGSGFPAIGSINSLLSSTGLKNTDTINVAVVTSTTNPEAFSTTAGVGSYGFLVDSVGLSVPSSNYTITYLPGTLTITPKALTVTANNQTKTYGDAFTFLGTEFGTSGLINGDTVNTVNLSSAGADALAAAGGYAINASGAVGSGLGNYTITYLPGTFTVDPKLLTITANSFSKEYGDLYTFNGTEFGASGLVNGDTVSSVSLTSAGAAATAQVAAPGPTYAITASGAVGTGLSNYTVSYVNGTLTVTPAPLTVQHNNVTKVYGEGFPLAALGTFPYGTVTGLKNGDSVTSTSHTSVVSPELFSTTAGVGTYGVNYSGIGLSVPLSNYTITYLPGTLTITPKALTVTANSFGKTYGSTYSFLGTEFGATGLINGDTVSTVDLASAGAAGTANVGAYDITASNALGTGLSNYDITYVKGTLTVNQARLLLQANNQTKTYGDTFVFNGTEFTIAAGSLFNGDTVDTVDLTSTGAPGTAWTGGYAISASNATGTGLTNYSIGYADGIMTVNPRLLTLTADDQTKTYGTNFIFTGAEFTANGLVNGDTVSGVALSSLGSPALATPGTYAIDISGAAGGKHLSNYNIVYVNGTMTIPAQQFAPNFQIDPLGRPVISVANQAIVLDRPFEIIDTSGTSTNVSIASAGTSAQALANIAPAAGGNEAEDLANLEPAAGGNDTPATGYTGDVGCANDFLDDRPCDNVQ